jgi:putative membrane protein
MALFTNSDREAIAQAIREAERNTSGEIVAIVADSSDNYRFIALLWAALIALTLPLLLIYVPRLTSWKLAFQGPEIIYVIQLVWFVVLALFFQLRPVRFALAPASVKRARVRRAAIEQFLAHNLHTTSGRAGVLIYVSVAERRAEIIADSAIAQKVEPQVWRNIVGELVGHIGAGRPAAGFIEAISNCGAVLAAHFPPGRPNGDELPNRLIELERG